MLFKNFLLKFKKKDNLINCNLALKTISTNIL